MSASANLALPFIEGGELLPDVTLNETLRLIDTLLQLAIVDRDLNAPPGAPAEGQRWIVKASPSPTGAWAGHANHVAAWQDGGWVFCAPQVGWFAYVIDEGALVAWNSTAWVSALAMLSSLQNLSLLGVGTTADSSNPFSAKLNNALWVAKAVAEGGDGHLRYKLSKESTAKTLSLLFQDNFSGRAEIGLTGDDDFHFKVSADGSSWLDAITIDRTTAKLVANQGFTNPTATRAQLYAAPFDALAFNGLQIDGSGDISQANGATQLTLVSDTETYVTDAFLAAYKNSGAVVKARQLAAASFPSALSGYSNAVELKATTALASLANGDYAKHIALIEGYRVARLGFGAAGAQSLSYAFQYYSPRTATIFVKFSNSSRSRCYYDEKAVVAGWNWITGMLAGDTSGSWDKTSGIGLRIEVFSAGKTASPATAGSWGSTDTTQTTNSTQNNLSTTNDATLVTGLIVLPGLELPPASRAPLIMRSAEHELRLCQRYFAFNRATLGFWAANSSTALYVPIVFDGPMRAAATVAVVGGTAVSGATVPGAAFKDVTGVSWDISPVALYLGGIANVTTATIGAQTYDRLGELSPGVLKFDARL
ncbi:MAG: DUF2793 domain-containing protein [Xanthobacteraceae bacterium]